MIKLKWVNRLEKWKIDGMRKDFESMNLPEKYMKTWINCKLKTNLSPHDWLNKFDSGRYGNISAIGWLDAISAIEAVVNKYEEFIAECWQEKEGK
jgi:hypothetical protein